MSTRSLLLAAALVPFALAGCTLAQPSAVPALAATGASAASSTSTTPTAPTPGRLATTCQTGFAGMDTNQDGAVTLDEYMAVHGGKAGYTLSQVLTAGPVAVVAKPVAVVAGAPTARPVAVVNGADSTGKLPGAADTTGVVKPIAVIATAPGTPQYAFEQLDANHDGKLTPEEFCGAPAPAAGQ